MHSEVWISGTKSSQRPVTSGVPQVSIPGSVVFNVFVCDRDDATDCSLSTLADSIKLREVVDVPEVFAAIQRDLHKLEKQLDRNLMKISPGKHQVHHVAAITSGTREGWWTTGWKAALQKRMWGPW